MSKTPGQRIEIFRRRHAADVSSEMVDELVRLVRAAENAAIKRCAERAHELAHRSALFDRAYTYDRIMDLQSRAPRAKAKGRP